MPRCLLHTLRFAVPGLLALGLALSALGSGPVLAQADARSADPRVFPDTGYAIADDAIWTFFTQHGGVTTFGQPISREFTLLGLSTQLFENAALQVQTDDSVQPMQLSDPGLLPYARLNGLTVPVSSASMAMLAPSSDQPDYPGRLVEFLRAGVPDSWSNQPVQFLATFASAADPTDPSDALLQGLGVWGLPTSTPAVDPNNPNFVYQRFQNSILLYDATAGTTSPLPLGQYLKEVLTGQNLPADLESESATTPLRGQYDPSAFVPDVG